MTIFVEHFSNLVFLMTFRATTNHLPLTIYSFNDIKTTFSSSKHCTCQIGTEARLFSTFYTEPMDIYA